MPFCYQVSALHKLLALHGLSYCLESVCPRAEVLNFSEVRPTNDFMHRVPLVLSFLLWSGRCSLLCDFRGETQETGPVAATGSEVVTLPADGGLAGLGRAGAGFPLRGLAGARRDASKEKLARGSSKEGKNPGLLNPRFSTKPGCTGARSSVSWRGLCGPSRCLGSRITAGFARVGLSQVFL